jgi:hypothetical protein
VWVRGCVSTWSTFLEGFRLSLSLCLRFRRLVRECALAPCTRLPAVPTPKPQTHRQQRRAQRYGAAAHAASSKVLHTSCLEMHHWLHATHADAGPALQRILPTSDALWTWRAAAADAVLAGRRAPRWARICVSWGRGCSQPSGLRCPRVHPRRCAGFTVGDTSDVPADDCRGQGKQRGIAF